MAVCPWYHFFFGGVENSGCRVSSAIFFVPLCFLVGYTHCLTYARSCLVLKFFGKSTL